MPALGKLLGPALRNFLGPALGHFRGPTLGGFLGAALGTFLGQKTGDQAKMANTQGKTQGKQTKANLPLKVTLSGSSAAAKHHGIGRDPLPRPPGRQREEVQQVWGPQRGWQPRPECVVSHCVQT